MVTEGERKDAVRPVVRVACPPGYTAWLIGAPGLLAGAHGLTSDLGATTDLPSPDGSVALPPAFSPAGLTPIIARCAGDAHDPLGRRVTTGVLHVLVGGASVSQQVTHIVAARRTAWGDDVLSRLMLHGRPTFELVTANIALLHATFEATARLITDSVQALLRRPTAWRRLCADPALAPAAADSTLRHLGVDLPVIRRARHDLTIAGQHIAAGDFVAATAPSEDLTPVRARSMRQLALLQLTVTLERLASHRPVPAIALSRPPRGLS